MGMGSASVALVVAAILTISVIFYIIKSISKK